MKYLHENENIGESISPNSFSVSQKQKKICYFVLTTDTQSGSNKTRKGVLPKNPLNLTMGPYFWYKCFPNSTENALFNSPVKIKHVA